MREASGQRDVWAWPMLLEDAACLYDENDARARLRIIQAAKPNEYGKAAVDGA
jgi:hypothetical protein